MAGKKRPAPRELMELAVKVMSEAIAEPRSDGKASPLVGAVLLKADGTVETASRGELRDGDHAEFTLLERKNRSAKLDGAVLLSTLEPCAPGARHFPKLSCAERIILARIRDVWVGIEDPDPTVDRKGIKYLQDHGVKVNLFDRDLQEVIREKNKDFIEQAEERAAASHQARKAEPIVLSSLEEAVPATDLSDLSTETLEAYRAETGVDHDVGSEDFQRRLVRQGLLRERDGAFVPNGYGLILFGKEPRLSIVQAGLLGTIHYPDGTEETRDFDGPQVTAPGQAIQWLRDKLPNPIDRTEARRRERHGALYELVREGIVNALVHRDYGIQGAKCQLAVSPDKIVVMSPGLPVPPITMEQLQAFDAPMLSRHPQLHFVFAKMALAEERGLGLKSMKLRAADAGLPLPAYSYLAPYVTLTFYRKAEAAIPEDRAEVLDQLTEAERKGWAWMVTQGEFSASEYGEALGLPERTTRNHISKLRKLDLLEKLGAGPATKYRVVRH